MSKFTVTAYNPAIHRDAVLQIFISRPDIFPENEILEIEEETKYPGNDSLYKIVACSNDKVAGYCGAVFTAKNKLWYLDWLAVDSRYQRQGIGRLLLVMVLNWLEGKHVKELRVETCSCGNEAPARAFYQSQGFVEEKTEIDGYSKGHSKITYLKRVQ